MIQNELVDETFDEFDLDEEAERIRLEEEADAEAHAESLARARVRLAANVEADNLVLQNVQNRRPQPAQRPAPAPRGQPPTASRNQAPLGHASYPIGMWSITIGLPGRDVPTGWLVVLKERYFVL